MSHAPSTFGTMITSSRSPISVTSVVMSSSTHGDSSELTRVQSAVSPRSISLPIFTSPARAGSLRSTGMASSRLPSTMSALAAVSGSFPTIFSLLGSKKWIIRDGVTGISVSGAGAPTASGLTKSRGLRKGKVLLKIGTSAATGGGKSIGPPLLRFPPPSDKGPNDDRDRLGAQARHRPGDARGVRRPPLRPLPRGVRGRRRVQALAGEDDHRGRRPPLLPDHDEPPPAAHQRRVRVAVAAGPERRGRPARLLADARHDRERRLRQGDREPRDGRAEASGARVPRRHALRGVGGARGNAVAFEAGSRRREGEDRRVQAGRHARRDLQASGARTQEESGLALATVAGELPRKTRAKTGCPVVRCPRAGNLALCG